MKNLEIIYKDIIFNEAVFNTEFSKKINNYQKLKLSLFVIALICKLILYKLFSKKEEEVKGYEKIAFVWSDIHKKKIKQMFPNINVIDISRTISFKKIKRYKDIKILKLFSRSIKTDTRYRHVSNDSYFYKIYIVLEYYMLKEQTKHVKNVVVAGHFDRYVNIFSQLSRNNNFKLSLMQHGCIQIYKKGLKSIPINGDIYYMYDFSIPFFNTFLCYTEKTNLYPQNSIHKLQFLKPNNNRNTPLIVVACQDVNPENNLLIIDKILTTRKYKNFTLQIMPHPRENINYYKEYKKKNNVIVSKNKDYQPDLVFTRFSTLGVEYQFSGTKTVFINIDLVQMDFLLSKNFNVTKKINDIENYIKTL